MSSTTILSHTTLYVFHRLILEKLNQVASKDIQYLETSFDQFFLGQDQATSNEPSYIQLLLVHMSFLLDLA
jgi:hypothetical protein